MVSHSHSVCPPRTVRIEHLLMLTRGSGSHRDPSRHDNKERGGPRRTFVGRKNIWRDPKRPPGGHPCPFVEMLYLHSPGFSHIQAREKLGRIPDLRSIRMCKLPRLSPLSPDTAFTALVISTMCGTVPLGTSVADVRFTMAEHE